MSSKTIALMGIAAAMFGRHREQIPVPEDVITADPHVPLNEAAAERKARMARRAKRKADKHRHQYWPAVITDENNVSYKGWKCACGRVLD